uniref:Uncharacterized protein n=1 Tax=Arundo donax TaxID=35708 RepID=A0A0A9FZC3_ARUDO
MVTGKELSTFFMKSSLTEIFLSYSLPLYLETKIWHCSVTGSSGKRQPK